MKGPRSRHRFNVQRVWECPACLKRSFAPPQVVTCSCECQGKDRPTSMRLIEASRVRVKKPEIVVQPDERSDCAADGTSS